MGLLRVTLACLAVALSGCDGGRYEVEVRFDPESLADEAQTVEIALVADCAGQTLGEAPQNPIVEVTATRMNAPMALGALDAGDYGLLARAIDGDCAVIAAGCEDVSVEGGGSGLLSVTISAATGPGCLSGTMCMAGRCVGRMDGGPPVDCPGGCDDGDDCTDEICMDSTCVYSTRDADQDGHGDVMCPELGSIPADDCDDDDPDTYEGATEICNGVDEDCDMNVDEDFDCAIGQSERCNACGDGERACQAGTCTYGPCLPVADAALVAAYTFDGEAATDTITDATGAHDGTVVGAPATYDAGPFGCGDAFVADGTAPYAEVPNAAAFELAAGSIRTWVRFDADGVGQGVWGRDASGTTLPGHLGLTRNAMDFLRARIQNLAGQVIRCPAAPVTSGQWHEVIVRWGPPDFEMIVDGLPARDAVVCDDTVNTDGIVGNMNPFVFGAGTFSSDEGMATPTNDPLNGAIAHFELRSGRAPVAAPEITNFVLVDAANDVDLGALADNAVIDTGDVGSFTIRVNPDPLEIDHVQFAIDGVDQADTESNPPYTLNGDNATTGDYFAWNPGPGSYTITATAYASPTVAGPSRSIDVRVR